MWTPVFAFLSQNASSTTNFVMSKQNTEAIICTSLANSRVGNKDFLCRNLFPLIAKCSHMNYDACMVIKQSKLLRFEEKKTPRPGWTEIKLFRLGKHHRHHHKNVGTWNLHKTISCLFVGNAKTLGRKLCEWWRDERRGRSDDKLAYLFARASSWCFCRRNYVFFHSGKLISDCRWASTADFDVWMCTEMTEQRHRLLPRTMPRSTWWGMQ